MGRGIQGFFETKKNRLEIDCLGKLLCLRDPVHYVLGCRWNSDESAAHDELRKALADGLGIRSQDDRIAATRSEGAASRMIAML